MLRFIILSIATTHAFLQHPHTFAPSLILNSKKGDAVDAAQQKFSVGSFVEFQEKSRVHVGKIAQVEQKGNGASRYNVIDSNGKLFSIADKSISYTMPCPTTPGQAEKLYTEFCQAQDTPLDTLQERLGITPELLELVWEDLENDEESSDHSLTAASLVDSVSSDAASAIEKYLAWQLLKSDTAHIFFKEIKTHGRVVAFKCKAKKAVDAAKLEFCKTHNTNELCFL